MNDTDKKSVLKSYKKLFERKFMKMDNLRVQYLKDDEVDHFIESLRFSNVKILFMIRCGKDGRWGEEYLSMEGVHKIAKALREGAAPLLTYFLWHGITCDQLYVVQAAVRERGAQFFHMD